MSRKRSILPLVDLTLKLLFAQLILPLLLVKHPYENCFYWEEVKEVHRSESSVYRGTLFLCDDSGGGKEDKLNLGTCWPRTRLKKQPFSDYNMYDIIESQVAMDNVLDTFLC